MLRFSHTKGTLDVRSVVPSFPALYRVIYSATNNAWSAHAGSWMDGWTWRVRSTFIYKALFLASIVVNARGVRERERERRGKSVGGKDAARARTVCLSLFRRKAE